MITSRTAHADQLHAEVRDARCCDALDPCAGCKAKTRAVVAIRHAERVAAAKSEQAPRVPQPRTGDLRARLAAALA